MNKIKKWSQDVIQARERYLTEALRNGNVYNELSWPLFDIGDDVTNKDFSRNGRITKVYCTDAGVKIFKENSGRDLSMEPWWWYVVQWEDGEIDHANLGFQLRED